MRGEPMKTSLDSPALEFRSQYYPAHFGDRVPKRVRMLQTVRSDIPVGNRPRAIRGWVYGVWVNTHGAVVALTQGGTLGLKPDEFEVVEWHSQEEATNDNEESVQ